MTLHRSDCIFYNSVSTTPEHFDSGEGGGASITLPNTKTPTVLTVGVCQIKSRMLIPGAFHGDEGL